MDDLAVTSTTLVGPSAMPGSSAVPSLNLAVSASDLVVVGTVVAVSPARWNSLDGSAWERVAVDRPVPTLYRTVTLSVEDVVDAGPGSTVLPTAAVEITVVGSGVAGPTPEDQFRFVPQPDEGLRDGSWPVGRRVLALLRSHGRVMAHSDGSWTDGIGTAAGTRGVWVLDGAEAEGFSPGWSGPLDRLIDRIRQERQLGRRNVADPERARDDLFVYP